jgi:hypothetical protein
LGGVTVTVFCELKVQGSWSRQGGTEWPTGGPE